MPSRCPGAGAPAVTLATRSFLFLQGPQSLFFERVGRALMARGHRVQRINLNLGDRVFWRLPATAFRGRFEQWPDFVARIIDDHAVTDLLVHGDCRPYHAAAAEVARQRNVAVLATDLGYVRPGRLTLEADGMTSRSRFPREPAAIRALAAEFPEPDLTPRFPTPLHVLALHDVAYNLAMIPGRALYPHYRHHGLYHPLVEYRARVTGLPRQVATWRSTVRAKRRLAAEPGSYFLFPLQLAGDFQLRVHSPFGDARDAVRLVIRSFADSGSDRRLAIVGHPLDEGLIDWRRLVTRAKLDRVVYLRGGIPDPLLAGAAGVVTINSTVGLTALRLGIPVKTLGTAIYDVAGLTHPGDLAGFWRDPLPPDGDLLAAFLRALIGATQVEGGYYTRASQAQALPAFVERLEQGVYPLPARSMLSCDGRRKTG
jgi:capsular polysaccharide export protein